MKDFLTSLVFIISFAACQSDDKIAPIAPVELSGCSNPVFTRVKEIKDVKTRIIAQTYTGTTGHDNTIYFIDQPDSGFTVPWLACNLPDQYKKHNLAIRISGYTLTYPGIERSNSIGSPIELARIEVDNTSK